jgi:hypothetical protein
MRKFFSAILFLLFVLCTRSQQLSQVTFSNASTLSWFSFVTDQGTLIRVSEDGKVLEWGTELVSERSADYYAPKLQPYLGRVTYYGTEADTINRGKIKSIGTCVLTYYGVYEMDEKQGRLKSVGTVNLDYYTRFENLALKGKLRTAGSARLEYYLLFENDALRGKLKTVGNTPISYYTSFDDKGKVKSIGTVSYDWSFLRNHTQFGGVQKPNFYRQNINGVTYILR